VPAPEALAAALGYAARGWSVIPIRAAGKVPLTPHGVKDASTAELTIRGWWRAWPEANVGIACGQASGLIVLDVDPRNGGDVSLEEVDAPPTLTALTGGGGRHFLYAAPAGPRRGRAGWRPGLDIKADGGYIVAPPSTHASGSRYAWIAPRAEVAPAPAWLVAATDPPVRPVVVAAPVTVRSDAQVKRVRSYIARLPSSIQGSDGSGALMRAAGRLAVEELAGKIAADDAWGLLVEYNERAEPPWSRAELERALDRARSDPRQTPLEDRERKPMARMTAGAPPPVETAEDWWQRTLWNKENTAMLRCAENAIVILGNDTRWAGRIQLDTFASNIRVNNPPWDMGDREFWSDTDDTRLQSWLIREHGLHLPIQDCFRAVAAVAEGNPTHPVRDWMESLRWDGTERLGTWLTAFLGAEDSPYTRAVGRWWLISAVARTYEPGCKADHVLILEGHQGIGKSSALRALAGPQWFSDTPLDLQSKDAFVNIQGRLIVELSELDSLRRSEVERVKAFFSSPSDTFRAPYARRAVTVPRSCVFAGTTNASQYLVDATGGRRFWPVACTETDLEGLARARTQLWAEAVAAYGKGERWWPESDEARIMVAGPQAERQVHDEWQPIVALWLVGRDQTDTGEILREALGIADKAKWGRAEQTRVGIIMAAQPGWDKEQVTESGVRRRVYKRNRV
jgi:predicted P-loop ATPase